jgi:Spy/CpxP family protein refolding chaperone
MSPDSTPDARSGYLSPDEMTQDLPVQYQRLREEMERLMAEPVKDFAAIDQLVDRLERLQLAIKEQHGIKGNNPNE